MRAKNALVESLLVERYARSTWWHNAPKLKPPQDDELTCARRRHEAMTEAEAYRPTPNTGANHA